MTDPSPLERYQHALAHENFVCDEAQQRVVQALQSCWQAVQQSGRTPRGLYLWGPPGRGKTWLMDAFHGSLSCPSLRLHFHHFMQHVHRRLFALTGSCDPLQRLAEELARTTRVLCFDEMFVSDIGDAILLGSLLQALFERGVVLVITSNQAPQQLYANGFNRERFLPAIAAIEKHMQILALNGEQDHRLHPDRIRQRYFVSSGTDDSILAPLFRELAQGQASHARALRMAHRELPVLARSESILWMNFSVLCEQPLSALDYIALCDQCRILLLDAVPALSATPQPARVARGTEDGAVRVAAGDRELIALARNDDSVRRFIALIDECYDRRVPVYINAAVTMHELYLEGALLQPFRRTLSRLQEMQWERFS